MNRPLRLASLAVLAGALVLPIAHVSPARATLTTGLGFGQPTVSGIQGDGYEQDIELDNTTPNETIYTSGPISTGSVSIIWKSTDGGRTFKEIPGQVPPTGKPLSCIGGGDTELAVDSAGHLYFADLWLGNFATARSDDGGKTFATASCSGVPDAGVDRQWYTAIGDPTTGAPNSGLFLTYDRLDQSVAACQGSGVGNALVIARSPGFGQPGSTAGGQFSPSTVLSCDEAIMGNDVSFTYADTGPRVFVIHDNAAVNDISVDRCDVIAPSATNPAGLSCAPDNVIASFPGFVTGANFPTISVDDHGGLFAVWAEAPGSGRGNSITGNTQLYFSTSSDEGTTWTAPKALPTPGLNQALFAWPASGDPGRVDVAFYGAPEAWQTGDTAGPDSTIGHYGLYVEQSLDNGATWTAPANAGGHFIHYGSMYTLIGGQSGNRALGDFLRLRVGPKGEAEISYADSNNFEAASDLSPQAMYVRQSSGPSLYAADGVVNGPDYAPVSCTTLGAHSATLDALGTSSADIPHLHLNDACITQPDSSHYQVTMDVADLTTPAGSSGPGPDPSAGGTTNLWQVQWHTPSLTEQPDGGEIWFVYMESVNGGAPTCWDGQSSQEVTGAGGAELTYPGDHQLTGSACTYTATAPGKITITVPIADVADAAPLSSTLYDVVANTQTLPSGNAESPPNTNTQGVGIVGGQFFNLIDVSPTVDITPGPPQGIPEAPWAGLLALAGVGVVAARVARRRRSRACRTPRIVW